MNLQKKDPDYFSDDLKNILSIITTKKGVNPVGSFSYKVHKYPSDIDIFEYIKYCCDLQNVKQRLVSKFKDMAKNITRDNEVFLNDFKAGFDTRFFYFQNPKQRNIIDKINSSPLFSVSKKKELIKLINEKKYKDYKEELRLLYTIRWSRNEILKGEKKLVDNKIIKLSKALTDNSDVKIDLIGKIDGRFREVTNYFYITWENKEGEVKNLTKQPEDRITSLEKDIRKYGEKDSLKFAKRLWLRSILLKNSKFVNLLNPLFSSDAAIMNQIKSEAEVLRSLVEKHFLPNRIKEDVINQIEEFKSRLSYVNIGLEDIHKNIDMIIENKDSEDVIIKQLSKIIQILSEKTEQVASDYIKKVGIEYNRVKYYRGNSPKKYFTNTREY